MVLLQHFLYSGSCCCCCSRDSAAVFAWKGETLEEYWWCTEQALTWPDADGADLLVDDGGDATLLIHEGVKAEAAYAKDGTLPDPTSTDNVEFQIVLGLIKDGLPKDPTKWTRMSKKLVECLRRQPLVSSVFMR
eukprot:jgi/Picre1/30036/NNA_005408.t1